MGTKAKQQTVTALVQNRAGVLARVVGLFARRGYNIASLAVAPTEDPKLSRITFVYELGSAPVEQVLRQVDKLINVISIEALEPTSSVQRELLVAQISCDAKERGEILELVQIYSGRVLDVGVGAVTVSVGGTPVELDNFENLVKSYGIVAMQRSGRIALPKLSSGSEETIKGK